MKEHNNFRYFWNFGRDMPNSVGEILFENPPNLQRMYELINVLHLVISQFLVAVIFFVTDCKELKLAQIV